MRGRVERRDRIVGAKPTAAAPGEAPKSARVSKVPIPKVPIGISNLVVRLDGRDDIGLASADFKIHLIERMRDRGFTAVGAENRARSSMLSERLSGSTSRSR